jgi:Protein of unknown function (DUF3304)
MPTNLSRRPARAALAAALAVLAVGCGPRSPAAVPVGDARLAVQNESPHSYKLTLYGYNYTDTEIGSFEVNGQGGGNLEVSVPTAGGGKSTCCVVVSAPLRTPAPVTIKWSRDGSTWCEQSVQITSPLPARPEYFEVHFYRDGHIEVAITERASPPRLQLEREHGNSRFRDEKHNMNSDSKFSRCKLGYR